MCAWRCDCSSGPRSCRLRRDLGKHVLAKVVDVPTGKIVTVEFKYVTPDYGSMFIQKQPGLVNLDINFTIREGGSIKKKQQVKLSSKARLNY